MLRAGATAPGGDYTGSAGGNLVVAGSEPSLVQQATEALGTGGFAPARIHTFQRNELLRDMCPLLFSPGEAAAGTSCVRRAQR